MTPAILDTTLQKARIFVQTNIHLLLILNLRKHQNRKSSNDDENPEPYITENLISDSTSWDEDEKTKSG